MLTARQSIEQDFLDASDKHGMGNGAAVRIPASVMQAAGLAVGTAADAHDGNGGVAVVPAVRCAEDFESLLEDITTKNLHPEIDFGPSVGRDTLN